MAQSSRGLVPGAREVPAQSSRGLVLERYWCRIHQGFVPALTMAQSSLGLVPSWRRVRRDSCRRGADAEPTRGSCQAVAGVGHARARAICLRPMCVRCLAFRKNIVCDSQTQNSGANRGSTIEDLRWLASFQSATDVISSMVHNAGAYHGDMFFEVEHLPCVHRPLVPLSTAMGKTRSGASQRAKRALMHEAWEQQAQEQLAWRGRAQLAEARWSSMLEAREQEDQGQQAWHGRAHLAEAQWASVQEAWEQEAHDQQAWGSRGQLADGARDQRAGGAGAGGSRPAGMA